jgi:hypothetical protein
VKVPESRAGFIVLQPKLDGGRLDLPKIAIRTARPFFPEAVHDERFSLDGFRLLMLDRLYWSQSPTRILPLAGSILASRP